MAWEWDEKVDCFKSVRTAGNAVSMQTPAIKGERTYLSSLTAATIATSKTLLLIAVFAVA